MLQTATSASLPDFCPSCKGTGYLPSASDSLKPSSIISTTTTTVSPNTNSTTPQSDDYQYPCFECPGPALALTAYSNNRGTSKQASTLKSPQDPRTAPLSELRCASPTSSIPSLPSPPHIHQKFRWLSTQTPKRSSSVSVRPSSLTKGQVAPLSLPLRSASTIAADSDADADDECEIRGSQSHLRQRRRRNRSLDEWPVPPQAGSTTVPDASNFLDPHHRKKTVMAAADPEAVAGGMGGASGKEDRWKGMAESRGGGGGTVGGSPRVDSTEAVRDLKATTPWLGAGGKATFSFTALSNAYLSSDSSDSSSWTSAASRLVSCPGEEGSPLVLGKRELGKLGKSSAAGRGMSLLGCYHVEGSVEGEGEGEGE